MKVKILNFIYILPITLLAMTAKTNVFLWLKFCLVIKLKLFLKNLTLYSLDF